MANSRKPAPTDTATDVVSRALAQWLAALEPPWQSSRFAIAFSGGRDSTVLLHALAQLLPPSRLAALHIHHGLHAQADDWQQHCQTLCAQLNVPFLTCKIEVPRANGQGIEAAAREARYAALVQLAQQAQCDSLLTAHHTDDQVESMLLQLLRGTGLPGAAGMAASKMALNSTLPQQRPLLHVPASALTEYATQYQLRWVEDPSNQNRHYARNALRHEVLPTVQEYFPDYRDTLTRFAEHAAQAQTLLNQLAHLDYVHCASATGQLHVPALLQHSTARQVNLLRYWFACHGLPAPSAARLHEVMRRLTATRQVRAWSVTHEDHRIRCEYDLLSVQALAAEFSPPAAIDFRWQGEPVIELPAWRGRWKFLRASTGIAADWLQQQTLSVRARTGGERLKLHPARPSRSLKNLYQEARIPHDRRDALPLLYAQDELLAVAGIGVDCSFVGSAPEVAATNAHIQIVWQAD